MIERMKLNPSLLVSLGSLVVLVIALVLGATTLLGAIMPRGRTDQDPQRLVAAMLEQHESRMTTFEERFNGRSMFYTPGPTPPPPPPPPPPREERIDEPEPEVIDRGPPPPPANYGGPPMIAILSEEAWFRSNMTNQQIIRIGIGEERSGVELVATDPPWSATVRWERGEYDVELFDSETPGLSDSPPDHGATPGLIAREDVSSANELTRTMQLGNGSAPSTRLAGRNAATLRNTASRSPNSGRNRAIARERRADLEAKQEGAETEAERQKREEYERELMERKRRAAEQRRRVDDKNRR